MGKSKHSTQESEVWPGPAMIREVGGWRECMVHMRTSRFGKTWHVNEAHGRIKKAVQVEEALRKVAMMEGLEIRLRHAAV